MTRASPSVVTESVRPGTAVRPRWSAVWALALVIATMNASEVLPASLLTPMSASFGVTEGLIGQSVTATAIAAILTSLLIGRIAPRVDRRALLLSLAVALVASNLVVALAPDAVTLLAARLVLGVCVGGVWGLAPASALRLVPSERVPRAMSIIFGGATCAMILAAPAATLLAEIVGWRGVFFTVAAIAVVAMSVLAFTLPAMPTPTGQRPVRVSGALRLPWLVPGLIGVMLFWAGAKSFATYLRPYLEAVTGLEAGGVSLVLLLVGVGNLVGTLGAAPLLNRNLRLALPAAAAAGATLLGLLLCFGQAPWAALAFPAAWSVCLGIAGVGWSTWVARSYPEHAEPAGGLLVAAIQGAMMLGALLGGALIDALGPIAPLAAAVALLGLGGAYLAFFMAVSRPRIGAAPLDLR